MSFVSLKLLEYRTAPFNQVTFSVYRSDRTEDSGKKEGGGVCFMANKNWFDGGNIKKQNANRDYRKKEFQEGNPRSMWQGLRIMTDYKPHPPQVLMRL